ncbi:type II/IV secretion system protein [Candidatus Peregrinibacteria bacterium]|nr:type II/IV secretion system protein [Candidatus Peregrinibacteria bacterium]
MAEAKDPHSTLQALSAVNRELEEKAAARRAQELKMPYINVGIFPINPDILHIVDEKDAREALFMLFFKAGKKLKAAAAEPAKAETQALVKNLEVKGFTVDLHLASASSVQEAFRFFAVDQYKSVLELKNIVKKEEIHYEQELQNLQELLGKIIAAPAEEALNMLHVSAIKAGASDIHYQPEEQECLIRFRIDGILHPVFRLPREVFERLAGQLKYKANMTLNVSSLPQDGRFRFIVNDRRIDVRVASLPTEFGEAFVCRILDSDRKFESFEVLGFSGGPLQKLNRSLELSQGTVLVTGPTSSGKTTTLYVLLQKFNRPELKIITLEDPIEYHLKGITQRLRTLMRQDPDVVMVGEIRDLQTAEVALQAALTGHLLLSTLHTNSAVETIPRLISMGVPNFMVAPALSIIIAQRLVRRLCKCAESREMSPEEKSFFERKIGEMKKLGVLAEDVGQSLVSGLKKFKGCEECSMTGFRGQLVVAEALEVDGEIEAAILKNASAGEIFALARAKGMLTMEEDALLKVMSGETTIEEVHRVVSNG